MSQTIYVAGYPKSGSVFLTRLLGDVLDSPTGAYWARHDHKDIATSGKHRKGPYVVRRGHFTLVDQHSEVPVPAPHRLAWRGLKDERLIHIFRDPRDIAVSAFHYFGEGETLNQMVQNMIRGQGPFRSVGPWNDYMWSWLHANLLTFHVKYEILVRDPYSCMLDAIDFFEMATPPGAHIQAACKRQSFGAMKNRLTRSKKKMPLGKDLNLRHMRKGQPGDWKNHFSREDAKMMAGRFNILMKKLGYIEETSWWKQV